MKKLFFVSIILIFSFSSYAQSQIDSLNKTLNGLNTKQKIQELNKQFSTFKYNNPQFAIDIEKLAIKYANELNQDTSKIQPLINIGIAFLNLTENDSARLYLNEAEKICQLKKHQNIEDLKIYLAQINNIYGILSYKQGDFDIAIDFYKKAEIFFEEAGDKTGLAKTYNNMAVIYRKIENYENALKYYLKSIDIHKERNDSNNLGISYNNVAIIYGENFLDNQDSFLFYIDKAIKINKKINNLRLLASDYNALGNYYQREKQYDSALDYLNNSIKIKKTINNTGGLSHSYSSICEIFIETQNVKSSKLYLDSLHYTIESTNEVEMIASFYKLSYMIDSIEGKYKDAFYNLRMYKEISDSIYKGESTKKINDLEIKYLNEKKDKEIKLKDFEIELKNSEIIANNEKIKRKDTILWALVIIILIAIISAFLIIRQNKKIRIANKLLAEQNDEINQQKEEIIVQRDDIIAKSLKIEHQNEDIKASINYAARIQNVLLTENEKIREYFPENFIFFKPRDIVSGDFYWATRISENKVIYTVADCTGHGVPGAFMSVLGISFLNEIITNNLFNNISSNEILNELRAKIKQALRQDSSEDAKTKDGMDMILCIIDFEKMELDFTGANNPIFITRKLDTDYQLLEYKGDRMPVGVYYGYEKEFKNQIIKLQKGDTIYGFSDGFPDQFGGNNNQKYYKARFKKLVLSIQSLTISEQKDAINKEFNEWIGNKHQQLDDILIMGVKI